MFILHCKVLADSTKLGCVFQKEGFARCQDTLRQGQRLHGICGFKICYCLGLVLVSHTDSGLTEGR